MNDDQFAKLLEAVKPAKGNSAEIVMKIATGVSTAGIVGAIFALFAMSESLTKVELSQGYIVNELAELKDFAKAPRFTHADAKKLDIRLDAAEDEVEGLGKTLALANDEINELQFQVRNLKDLVATKH